MRPLFVAVSDTMIQHDFLDFWGPCAQNVSLFTPSLHGQQELGATQTVIYVYDYDLQVYIYI